ncbi:MAG TPA: hypothetical protein VGD74_07175 [Vulgatibacter sp.]
MRSVATAAAALLAVSLYVTGAAGCSDNCTEMACSDSARLVFDPPLTASGHYSIVLRPKVDGFDGWKISCEVTLPWDGVGNPCNDDLATLERNCPGATEASAEARKSGCSSSTGIAAVRINFAAPHSVEVDVEQDGRQLVRARVEPSYEKFYPNGPSCDDLVCSQASTTVPLNP